eukprot:CAMPEP_0181201880 /NCGR_PEP_ID=MMETSP1096-20121128/18537_1 /TAXON_ID=156174 ORGANISM="Chrysochromulina ericina, Strain CCMP281" /NCGR_SAMPLE_ID=MMETSP1096 /ASSEMBLY_ACC=CAM_ASM_000453 /LENGTH=69 /DNA_ID=CAMNT_0023292341 /DNA_START=415 /DNA_END=624 /DNA_ORIENTATION=+
MAERELFGECLHIPLRIFKVGISKGEILLQVGIGGPRSKLCRQEFMQDGEEHRAAQTHVQFEPLLDPSG